MKLFLSDQGSSVDKTLLKAEVMQPKELIQKYSQCLEEISGLEINMEIAMKINNFGQFLKKVLIMLDNYIKIADNVLKERRVYVENYNIFLKNVLPEYESTSIQEYLTLDKKSTAEYDQGGVIKQLMEKSTQVQDFLSEAEKFEEEFSLYKQLLQLEKRELQAFLETLETKKYFEGLKDKAEKKHDTLTLELQGFMAGKKSVIDRFTPKEPSNKLEKIQADIKIAAEDLQNFQLIVDMIIVILGYREIDNFKKDKINFYYSIVSKIAKSEFEFN